MARAIDKLAHYDEVDRGYRSPCWIWRGGTDGFGYGRLRDGKKTKGAHRFFYEQLRGEIPNGLVIDHLCNVPACVNPDHLEPKSQARNIQRKVNAKLSAGDVATIRASADSHAALARRFAVSTRAIEYVRSGGRWGDLFGVSL